MEDVEGQRERLLFHNELFALEDIFDGKMKHFEGIMPQTSLIMICGDGDSKLLISLSGLLMLSI